MGITKKSFYRDPEVIFILLYNIITFFSYVVGELEPMYVIWAFYIQSLFIGAKYWFLEIYSQVRAVKKQWFFTLFFPLHFGMFHLVYLIFLLVMTSGSKITNLGTFFLINLIVLGVQLIAFIVREVSSATPYHKAPLIFAPYIRVLPMHAIILLGIKSERFGFNVFYFFIILKTLIDLVSYSWFDQRIDESVKS